MAAAAADSMWGARCQHMGGVSDHPLQNSRSQPGPELPYGPITHNRQQILTPSISNVSRSSAGFNTVHTCMRFHDRLASTGLAIDNNVS